jgi:hypothetical protein
MSDDAANPYLKPDEVRDDDGERADGRPTGRTTDDGLKPREGEQPTVAPEELGHHPTTEHGPGGDL